MANSMAKSGPTAGASLSSSSRSHSGLSSAIVPSMLSRQMPDSEPPTRPGTTSNGSISSSASANVMCLQTQSRARRLCCTPRSERPAVQVRVCLRVEARLLFPVLWPLLKGSHHAVCITTCSLRASFFRACWQLVASPRATHFRLFVDTSLLVARTAFVIIVQKKDKLPMSKF